MSESKVVFNYEEALNLLRPLFNKTADVQLKLFTWQFFARGKVGSYCQIYVEEKGNPPRIYRIETKTVEVAVEELTKNKNKYLSIPMIEVDVDKLPLPNHPFGKEII